MVGVGRHQLLGRSRGQGQRGRQGSEGDSLEPRTWTPLLSQSRRWIGRLEAVWTGQAWRRERSRQP